MRPVEVVLGVLILAMAAGHSSANYCVCKSGVDEKSLQSALDFACGAGADCSAISPNGACYNPNSLQAHCSYAVNSYYQKKAGSGATCDFNGAATLSSSNPSASGGCNYASGSGSSSSSGGAPSSSGGSSSGTSSGSPTSGSSSGSGSPSYGSGSGSGTTPVTVTPSTTPTTPSSTTPVTGTPGSTTSSPYSSSTPTTSATPSTSSPGILGGVGTGLGPTGTGMDDSHGGMKLQCGTQWMIFLACIIPGVMLSWN